MINQSTNQIVKYYGQNNTVMDGAHVHVYFAPNTEETAKRISDLLGTKTQVHTQENFAGHRLAPWLGHVMVSRQQTARALLTPGEVRELPSSDEIVIVAGLPPIRARKLRFHADRRFKNAVPPTDAQGRLTDPAHPRNPPTNLAARPYPYGPPVPKVMWSVSHAKSSATLASEAQGEIDREHGVDGGLSESDLTSPQTQGPDFGVGDTDAARRAFGLEQDKRQSHADPDLGWNL
jgi:type IV secretion system protein VirD4